MKLIQIVLPLRDNAGQPFPKAVFARMREELTDRFESVNAKLCTTVADSWEIEPGAGGRDVIVIDVMADEIEHAWWGIYRHTLEYRFGEDAVVIRVSDVECL